MHIVISYCSVLLASGETCLSLINILYASSGLVSAIKIPKWVHQPCISLKCELCLNSGEFVCFCCECMKDQSAFRSVKADLSGKLMGRKQKH